MENKSFKMLSQAVFDLCLVILVECISMYAFEVYDLCYAIPFVLSCLCVCIAKQLPFSVLFILIDIDYIFVLCSVAVGDACLWMRRRDLSAHSSRSFYPPWTPVLFRSLRTLR